METGAFLLCERLTKLTWYAAKKQEIRLVSVAQVDTLQWYIYVYEKIRVDEPLTVSWFNDEE